MRPNRIFILISCFHPFNSLCDVVKWGEKKAKKSSPPFSSSLSLAHTAGSAKPEASVAGRIFTFHRKSGRKGKVSSMCCRKQLQALLRGALSISSSGQWQLLPPRSSLVTSSTPHSLALLPWAPSFPVCPSPFQFQQLRWVLLKEPPCGRRRECNRTNLKASLLQPQLLANPTA